MNNLNKIIYRFKLLLIIPFFLLQTLCYSSESDPYTYSSIELNDASTELNRQFNKILLGLITKVKLQSNEASNPLKYDNFMEYQFIEYYNSDFRLELWNSNFENCIITNNCPDWNPIERINLKNGESIFDQTDYNPSKNRRLAPIINMCGVRIGTDKLTHMLEDGFRLYNYWMNKNDNLSLFDIVKISVAEEHHGMGRSLTGVMSCADIYANLAGVQLFKDLFYFGKYFIFDSKGIKFINNINLCEYINVKFDERVSKSVYTDEKAGEILDLIEKNKYSSELISNDKKSEILSRVAKGIASEGPEIDDAKGIVLFQSIFHPLDAGKQAQYAQIELFSVDERRTVFLEDSKKSMDENI